MANTTNDKSSNKVIFGILLAAMLFLCVGVVIFALKSAVELVNSRDISTEASNGLYVSQVSDMLSDAGKRPDVLENKMFISNVGTVLSDGVISDNEYQFINKQFDSLQNYKD